MKELIDCICDAIGDMFILIACFLAIPLVGGIICLVLSAFSAP